MGQIIHRREGLAGIRYKKPGLKHRYNSISKKLQQRIVTLKQRHPSWGARRIKYQYDLSCYWITVHRIIKSNGMLVRIKPNLLSYKRFQRRHIDSMWQGDTFQFRISGTGRVYVTGFTDDRSRFRVASKAYLHKSAAEAVDALRCTKEGNVFQDNSTLDNGRQVVMVTF